MGITFSKRIERNKTYGEKMGLIERIQQIFDSYLTNVFVLLKI
jgi:hypothetical protein